MEERRRSKRIVVSHAEVAMMPLTLTVQVLDISVAGVLLQSSRAVEPGARGALKLSLGGTPVTADIAVHRVVPGNGGAPGYRIGASFVSISPEHRQVIERFTSQ